VKEAVGDTVEIIIEGHGRFDVPTALRIGHALADYEVLWFEEPIPPDNKEGLAQVRQRVDVPIAAGERLYSRWDFSEFFRLGCADYIQPDVTHVGGLAELRKIASMAECHHLPICPHNPSGPVANAATLQIAACTPNFYLLETMASDVPYRNEISTERVRFRNGTMAVPEGPGLDIDIDERAIARHPYEPRDLRHYTGQLTDIRPDQATAYFEPET
jgi:galactonate dehydratase